MKTIFTIGYSCFEIDDFLKVLKQYEINCLIDVRSSPNSMYYTDYNIGNLKPLLEKNGIIYRNYQKEFGARQEDPQFYDEGYLDFCQFTRSEQFLEGVKKIEAGMERGFIFALMCAEKDPATCHRNIMVARAFHQRGYKIANILFDGTIETQESLEERLVDCYFPERDQLTLFQEPLSWEEIVDRSYQLRNSEIGYRLDKEGGDDHA